MFTSGCKPNNEQRRSQMDRRGFKWGPDNILTVVGAIGFKILLIFFPRACIQCTITDAEVVLLIERDPCGTIPMTWPGSPSLCLGRATCKGEDRFQTCRYGFGGFIRRSSLIPKRSWMISRSKLVHCESISREAGVQHVHQRMKVAVFIRFPRYSDCLPACDYEDERCQPVLRSFLSRVARGLSSPKERLLVSGSW